jgi:transposase
MFTTIVEDPPVEGYSDTRKELVQLRFEASSYKTHHRKALERERILRAKVKELEGPQRQEDQLKALTAGFQKTIEEQKTRIEELKAQNAWLKQRLFGRQSEQSNKDQDDNDIDDAVVPAIEKPQTKRPRGQQVGTIGHGRKSHEHLPSVEIIHDLKSHEKSCPECGLAFKPFPITADCEDIHYEVHITRRVHKRKSYLPTCNCGVTTGIVTAAPVPKLIPKGMFSVELWAHILAEKFLFQRPMSRLLQVLALEGLRISQGTITGGLQKIKEIVHPLYIRILEHSRHAHHRHMDLCVVPDYGE